MICRSDIVCCATISSQRSRDTGTQIFYIQVSRFLTLSSVAQKNPEYNL
jgi:hypothetical protein